MRINSFEAILLSIPGIIFAIVLHELAKAIVARKMGDMGVKDRITLNPMKHIDALGAIFIAIFGFGWASPVKLSPFHYKNRKKAMMLIFAIPFIISILLGLFFLAASAFWLSYQMQLNADTFQVHLYIVQGLELAGHISIGFAFLNLLPAHPFDGFIALSAINPIAASKIALREKFIQLIIALAIILGLFGVILQPLFDQLRIIFWNIFLGSAYTS